MKPAMVEAEVNIDRSPADVFDYCSDLRHKPEWNSMMKRIEKVTDGPIGVDTRYATKCVKGPPMVMKCVRYERPTQWSAVGESAAAEGGRRGQRRPNPRRRPPGHVDGDRTARCAQAGSAALAS